MNTRNDSTNAITLIVVNEEPHADSRIIASKLGIEHHNLLQTIRKYCKKIERFGQLLFQTELGHRAQGGGNPEKFALLNENQALAVMTLSRNTDQVVDLKMELVAAFDAYRRGRPGASREVIEGVVAKLVAPIRRDIAELRHDLNVTFLPSRPKKRAAPASQTSLTLPKTAEKRQTGRTFPDRKSPVGHDRRNHTRELSDGRIIDVRGSRVNGGA